MSQGAAQISFAGNLVEEAEVRYTPSGRAVAKFRVAVTERKFDRQTGQWSDGETSFYTTTAWGDMAEHVGGLGKGVRVMVTGVARIKRYETREGAKASAIEIEAEEVGVSIKWTPVKIVKMERKSTQPATVSAGGAEADPWANDPQPAF